MQVYLILISLSSAARRLGISESRARQLADAGRVAVVRDDRGRRLFDSEALENLARERARERERRRDV